MNVRCPSCSTVYRIDPGKIPAGGVHASCTTCTFVFRLTPAGVAGSTAGAATAARSPATVPPARAAAARVSRPFVKPAAPEPAVEAPAPPKRPSAPVFTPGPGTPVPVPVPPSAAAPEPEPARPAPAPPTAVPATQPRVTTKPINPFLAQDPRQKARRLARALVSDMIVYQPEKRQQAVRDGKLKEAFGEEIKKSWEEFVEQVGKELADSTTFFNDALNEILAGGEKLF